MSKISDEDFAAPAAQVEDEPVAPANFDFAAWVAGSRPARRSVMVYQRPDLLADLDEVMELESRAATEAERNELLERGKAIAAEMTASRLRIVVEARSSSWQQELVSKLTEAGITDDTERLLHLTAAQVVEPEGVTFETLRALAEVSEPQVVKIVQARTLANESAPTISARYLGKG